MDISDLPNELLVVIAAFRPGIEVGTLCLVSRRFNQCLQYYRRKMLLIYKVRARMMSNMIFLLYRHIHYYNCHGETNFAVEFTREVRITSYEKYREKKHKLIDGYSNVNFVNIPCYCCRVGMSLNYYVYDACNGYVNFFLKCCHKCFHSGTIAFYKRYGRLPNKQDDVFVFTNIIEEVMLQPLTDIPIEIAHCFNGLGGGVIHWYGM